MIELIRAQKICTVTPIKYVDNKRIYQCDWCGELSHLLQNEVDLRNWVDSHECPKVFKP